MSASLSEARDVLRAARITLALAGVVALIAGIVILVWPKGAAVFIVGIIAAYLIIAGLVYLGLGIFSKERTGWARVGHIVLGLVYVIAGIAAFWNITASVIALAIFVAILVGISWIIDGIVSLSYLGDAASKGWTLFYAIISIIGGVVVLFSPLYGALILWWILGITLVVLGVLQIVRAITLGRTVKKAANEIRSAVADASDAAEKAAE